MERRVCGKRRPLCGAQEAKDLGTQLSREVASPGRRWEGKAGWGTVVSGLHLLLLLCCTHSSPQGRGTDSSPSTALYQLGPCASIYVSGDGGRYCLQEDSAGTEEVFSEHGMLALELDRLYKSPSLVLLSLPSENHLICASFLWLGIFSCCAQYS